MSRLERVRRFKKQMDAVIYTARNLVRVDELTEEELLNMVALYEDYQVDYNYKAGDLFQLHNKLYKVIQDHTSQEGWIPGDLPALYQSLMPEGVIPEWVQPLGQHDAYQLGDRVIFNNKVYISLLDNNIWSPEAYPQGWELE